MQVKDRYLSQIPRNHYKWAGIRESVKPVAKVWFSPIAREKREAQIREHQRNRCINTDSQYVWGAIPQ